MPKCLHSAVQKHFHALIPGLSDGDVVGNIGPGSPEHT